MRIGSNRRDEQIEYETNRSNEDVRLAERRVNASSPSSQSSQRLSLILVAHPIAYRARTLCVTTLGKLLPFVAIGFATDTQRFQFREAFGQDSVHRQTDRFDEADLHHGQLVLPVAVHHRHRLFLQLLLLEVALLEELGRDELSDFLLDRPRLRDGTHVARCASVCVCVSVNYTYHHLLTRVPVIIMPRSKSRFSGSVQPRSPPATYSTNRSFFLCESDGMNSGCRDTMNDSTRLLAHATQAA